MTRLATNVHHILFLTCVCAGVRRMPELVIEGGEDDGAAWTNGDQIRIGRASLYHMTETEIMGALAHELGHCVYRHSRILGVLRLLSLLLLVVLSGIDPMLGGIAVVAGWCAFRLLCLECEYMADRFACRIGAGQGLAVYLLHGKGSDCPHHPPVRDRLLRIARAAANIPAVGLPGLTVEPEGDSPSSDV